MSHEHELKGKNYRTNEEKHNNVILIFGPLVGYSFSVHFLCAVKITRKEIEIYQTHCILKNRTSKIRYGKLRYSHYWSRTYRTWGCTRLNQVRIVFILFIFCPNSSDYLFFPTIIPSYSIQLKHESWILLDSFSEAGGLACTDVTPEGFLFDMGGHVIFSHYNYFDQLIDAAVGTGEENWAV
jgi:hypothetical protein